MALADLVFPDGVMAAMSSGFGSVAGNENGTVFALGAVAIARLLSVIVLRLLEFGGEIAGSCRQSYGGLVAGMSIRFPFPRG